MAEPIPGAPISTPYGARGPYWSCSENSAGEGVHTGVDFAADAGTDVLAPCPGQIRHRNYGSAFGNHQFAISPDPGQAFADGEVFFAHMTARPADGSYVATGDYLGPVGAEGNVSGPHLHMEYHPSTKGAWSCATHDDPAPVVAYTDTAPPPGDYLIGIDVSSNNDDSWHDGDWAYCWVKATEGRSYVNPDAADQLEHVRGAGKLAGHYHWLNDGDVDAQVDWFIENADVRPGELIACDWEDPSDPTTAQKDAWIDAIRAAYPQNRVGLYCNRDWWLNHDTSSYFGDYLWIANYTTAADPGIQADWTFWQYTATPYDQNRGRFDTLADLVAWAACDDPPPAPDPGWEPAPHLVLDDPTPDPDRNVSYLQAVVRVGPVTATDDGHHYTERFVVAQDLNNDGNLRFAVLHPDGTYQGEWMTVSDAGHGQTFHAYRSAAGNFYLWCGENPAYRYAWQKGKTVARSSGTKLDYQGCRPVGSHEPWVGFRDATDSKETFYLFDRTDFTDGTNRTRPAKQVTISKQTKRSQQSWAVTEDRIYRLSGSTNDDPPHGTMLHVFEVFDWSGARLLELDVTAMSIDTSSDEPEGITFTGTPGDVLVGKREGSTDPKKRSYPLWKMVGLP
jgi:hypothetical protein